jgi:hypothetical protein
MTEKEPTEEEDREVAMALLRQAAAMQAGVERDRLIALALKLDPDVPMPEPNSLN